MKKSKRVNTRLAGLIEEAGVTAERIAADADVRAPALHRYVVGLNMPRVDRAIRICEVLSGLLGREVTAKEVFC